MPVFKKLQVTARSSRGVAEDMLISQFLEDSWTDYVN